MSGNVSFGRYELLMEMAKGGMATLYLARLSGPAQFEKLVVIKRVHAHLAEQKTFVDMFLDEARISGLINHPNVAAVFDMGQADGSYFLAMEYVHGHNLTEILRANRRRPDVLTWALAARIAANAAAGLHAAHGLQAPDGTPLQVVHRDVSPSNILVGYGGEVKVVDFGIATAAQRLTTTATGTLKGKIAYMSPEQVSGEPVTARSDIFSLGIVLWESLTGRRLFRADNDAATIRLILEGEIPSPRALNPAMPVELEHVVFKALERDPDHRFATAGDFEEAIEEVISGLGRPVGRKQLAVMMDRFFHDLKRVKDEQIRIATESRETSGPMRGLAMGRSQTESSTFLRESAPDAAVPPRRVVLPWVVAGAGLLLAVLTLAYLLIAREGAPPRSAAAPPRAPAEAMRHDAPRTPMRPHASAEAAPRPRNTAPAPRPEARIAVSVTVVPRWARAVITFRGRTHRGNQLRLRVAPQDTPETLRVQAPGYFPKTIQITPSADVHRTVTLRPVPRRRRARKRRTAADWVKGI